MLAQVSNVGGALAVLHTSQELKWPFHAYANDVLIDLSVLLSNGGPRDFGWIVHSTGTRLIHRGRDNGSMLDLACQGYFHAEYPESRWYVFHNNVMREVDHDNFVKFCDFLESLPEDHMWLPLIQPLIK